MSAFDALVSTLVNDPNLGTDMLYQPQNGSSIQCRVIADQPDIESQLGAVKVQAQQRIFLIRSADVAQPAVGDTAQIPPGGASYRVMTFRAKDALRLMWKVEFAPL